jgi:hypothetical protein
MLIAYMRVSKSHGTQTLDLQRDALLTAGVASERLYEDRVSGRKDARPGLNACLKALQPQAGIAAGAPRGWASAVSKRLAVNVGSESCLQAATTSHSPLPPSGRILTAGAWSRSARDRRAAGDRHTARPISLPPTTTNRCRSMSAPCRSAMSGLTS